MSTERGEKFRIGLHELALEMRVVGQQEFRIAAARMFRGREMIDEALSILLLDVDEYLTPEEIADRKERIP